MYTLNFESSFELSYRKLIKGDIILEKKLKKVLELLINDPKYPSLKSHKVKTIDYTDVWSSWVTGDIRLAWTYDQDNKLVIICLKLGTHSGANQIYNKKSS